MTSLPYYDWFVSIDNVQARLVNGSQPLEGRLEVYRDGQWGVVCQSGVDVTAAKVFCAMMGYR